MLRQVMVCKLFKPNILDENKSMLWKNIHCNNSAIHKGQFIIILKCARRDTKINRRYVQNISVNMTGNLSGLKRFF